MPLLTGPSGTSNINSKCTESVSNISNLVLTSTKSESTSSDCARLLDSAINSNLFPSSISPATSSTATPSAIVTPTTATTASSQCSPHPLTKPTHSSPTNADENFHSPLLDGSTTIDLTVGQTQRSNSISQIPLSPIPIGAAANQAGRTPAAQIDLDDFDELAAKIPHESKLPKSSNSKREKLKSFIEFDDEEDNGRNFDGTAEPYHQNNGSEYGQEFSKVFSEDQTPNDDADQNNEEEEEEWNQFQAHSDQNNISLECLEKTNDLFNSIEAGQLTVDDEIDEDANYGDEDDEDDDEVDEDDFVETGQLYNKLHRLEQEQDLLNNSLLALTSHFAQVQFRLRQIVDAKDVGEEKRAKLLQELENFANRGIPELMIGSSPTAQQFIQNSHFPNGHQGRLERSVSMATSLMNDDVFEDDDDVPTDDTINPNSVVDENVDNNKDDCDWNQSSQYFDCDSFRQGSGFGPLSRNTSRHHSTTSTTMLITEEKLERQRSKQKELIEQLKDQLEDLERYAYETGELNSLPSSMLLERQNAIIEQIKSKLPVLSIDEIDKLSPEELRQKVDTAVKELVNPALMKEQLVSQLKTQVTDLERFIVFLQQAGAYKNGSKAHKQSRLSFLRMSKLLKFQNKYSNSTASGATNKSNTSNGKQTKSLNSRFKIGTNLSNGKNIPEELSANAVDDDDVISSEKNIDKLPGGRGSANRSQKNSTSSVRSEASVASLNFETSSSCNNNQSNLATNGDTSNNESSSAQTAAIKIIRRIFSLLHVFTWTQFGLCTSFSRYSNSNSTNSNQHPSSYHNYSSRPHFEQNILKKSDGPYGRHWGDLRAKLDIVINMILELYREKNMNDSDYTSDSEEFATIDENGIVNDRALGGSMMTNAHQGPDGSGDIDCANGELRRSVRIGANSSSSQYFAYEQMTVLVRKELSTVLRNLIQHGLIVGSSGAGQQSSTVIDECGRSRPAGPDRPVSRNSRNPQSSLSSTGSFATSIIATTASHAASGLLTLSRLGCFSTRGREIAGNTIMMIKQRPLHAWELILYYYDLKNGSRFRSTPTRRLSQSFGLQAVTGTICNPKHSLLAAIDDIIDSHTRLKRSYDSHFKAFVCMALNQQMLSQWLRLILRQTSIVSDCYEKWSYTASTGFEDALRQLDKLSTLRFCLPTNLAIRQLQSIHDAF